MYKELFENRVFVPSVNIFVAQGEGYDTNNSYFLI